MVRIFNGRLPVHYSQAYVESCQIDDFDLRDFFRGQLNGLCGAAFPGMLFLTTGLHTGDVGFTLDMFDEPPPLDDTWEDIVEVSFTPGSNKVILSAWEPSWCTCNIPLLQKTYRVRYCARGMDLGSEVNTYVEGEPVDFYSLAFWQSELASDVVVKQTSQIAADCHNFARTMTDRV